MSIYRSAAGEQAVVAWYDRILAYWPPGTEQLYLDTRHGRTFALALGERTAPPLVLLHGAGANALSWTADAPLLARHFRIYAVDTPGDPGRSEQVRLPWTGSAIEDWLSDVLDGLGAEAAILAGISQGGFLALRFATAKPGRVRGLVLLAPGGVAPASSLFALKIVSLSLLGRRGVRRSVHVVIGRDELSPAAIDYMVLTMTQFRPRMERMPVCADEALRRLRMPVLLVAGESDAIFPTEETAARISRLVPQADIRILPHTGHALMNTAPAMLEFLQTQGLA